MKVVLPASALGSIRWHFQNDFGIEVVLDEMGEVFSALQFLLKSRAPEQARCSQITRLANGDYQIKVNDKALDWIIFNLL